MRRARNVLAILAVLVAADLAAANGGSVHDGYEALLKEYVADGRVDYARWSADDAAVAALSRYVDRLEATEMESLESSAALAFWINLYNAATLELLLQNQPVESIKELGGLLKSPWKRELVRVGGEDLTLDEIENEIIRPRYGDARIHFALNCAALSCPPLQSFAFRGDRLEEQLERVTREALADPRYVDASACDGSTGRIELNKIFDWYRGDFENSHGGLRAFLREYVELPEGDACEISFKDYDWSLNAKVE